MRAMIKRSLVPLALVAVGLIAPSVAQAKAKAVTCGQVVKADLTLTKDLDCSTVDSGGLVVGKDGITIDLNGHTISGAGASALNEGIENEGHDEVTIRGGVITGFQDSLFFGNVAKNTVTKMKLRSGEPATSNGISSTYGTGNRFIDNKFFSPNYGIVLANGSENEISGNTFKLPNRAVSSTNEAFDDISDNTSVGFGLSTYAFYSQGDYRTTFENDVADGGYQGFIINKPQGVVLKGVEANENGYAGIYIDGPSTKDYVQGYSAKVVKSTANDNDEYGIYAAFGIMSRANTALGNDFYNCVLAACNGPKKRK